MAIWDMTGQERRAALDGWLQENVADPLNYFLGPTGIPERVGAANEILNPVVGMEDAAGHARAAYETGDATHLIPMVTEVAGALAPVTAHKPLTAGAADAANAVSDVLTGVTAGAQRAAGNFLADESGAVQLPELLSHHNTSAEKLAFADELGGMPYPSIGVSRVDAPLTNFGDVTLIGDKSFATPSRNNLVYRGDGYTVRQPRGEMEFSDPKAFQQGIGSDPRFSHLRGPHWFVDGQDNLSRADELFQRAEHAIETGAIDPTKFDSMDDLMYAARREVPYMPEGVSTPGLKQYSGMKTTLPPEDRFTPSGNRRKNQPYTLENVMKRMKKEARNAGGEGFNYGVPSFRAKAEPRLKTFKDVSNARNTLAPRTESEEAYDAFERQYHGLLSQIADDTGLEGFMASDQANEFLQDYAAGKARNWTGTWADNLSPEYTLADVDAMIEKSRSLPVEYMEAKPQRAVDIGEFKGAIVPQDAVDVIERLKRHGIDKIETYTTGEERVNLFKKFPELMFGLGGLAMLPMLEGNDDGI